MRQAASFRENDISGVPDCGKAVPSVYVMNFGTTKFYSSNSSMIPRCAPLQILWTSG